MTESQDRDPSARDTHDAAAELAPVIALATGARIDAESTETGPVPWGGVRGRGGVRSDELGGGVARAPQGEKTVPRNSVETGAAADDLASAARFRAAAVQREPERAHPVPPAVAPVPAREHRQARRRVEPALGTTAGVDHSPEAPISLPARDAAIAEAEERMVARLRRADRSSGEIRRELHEIDELDASGAEEIIERLTTLAYLDDDRMAEALVERLITRKGSGIDGVRRELRRRLFDDEVIERALADRERSDEYARAGELAQQRAARMTGLDRDTAMRRLVGFLQRRGYSGGVAMIAAGEALEGRSASESRRFRSGDARERVYFGNDGSPDDA